MDVDLIDSNFKDLDDLGKFKLPINGKMSIAILKIPQPMIIIGNQVNSLSKCRCNGNGTCKNCINTEKGVFPNSNSSLIKLGTFNKSDKLDESTDKSVHSHTNHSESQVKIISKDQKLFKNLLNLSKIKRKLKLKRKIKKKNFDKKNKNYKLHNNKTINKHKKLKKIKRFNSNSNNMINNSSKSNRDKNSIDEHQYNEVQNIIQIPNIINNQLSNILQNVTQLSNDIINNNKFSTNIHPQNLQFEDKVTNEFDLNQKNSNSEKTDKCVDTYDIEYSMNSHLEPNNLNILDHLNEVETLLNIERKRRFNEIRRDYSLLRDKLEEKFHLVVSVCNGRLLDLNSSYLNVLSSIKSNLSTIKLPDLKHIKHELNLL